MKLAGIDRRGKLMLCIAWMGSFICSAPQAYIFHVAAHPNITHYEQCVTYGTFKYEYQEVIYSFVGLMLMYALPLLVIIFCYASIYIELYKKSKKCVTGESCSPSQRILQKLYSTFSLRAMQTVWAGRMTII